MKFKPVSIYRLCVVLLIFLTVKFAVYSVPRLLAGNRPLKVNEIKLIC